MISLARLIQRSIAIVFFSVPAFAQSEQDFINAFSGQWYVFDQAMRSGPDACALTLSDIQKDEMRQAEPRGCLAPLATVDKWSIREGQIILFTPTAELAVMGGNQFRVTGEVTETGESLVVERAQGDGNSVRIAAALRKHKCYFVGFTQQCADASDLQVPQVKPDEGFAMIETLASINARAQPRRDASILGNIEQGTSVRVNQCMTASDGPWCRAQIGEAIVWLAMTALRQDEWPIVTFRASVMP